MHIASRTFRWISTLMFPSLKFFGGQVWTPPSLLGLTTMVAWLSSNALVFINVVDLHWARLIPGWACETKIKKVISNKSGAGTGPLKAVSAEWGTGRLWRKVFRDHTFQLCRPSTNSTATENSPIILCIFEVRAIRVRHEFRQVLSGATTEKPHNQEEENAVFWYPDVKGTRQKAFWEADGIHEATEEIESSHERQPCWDINDRENVVNEYGVCCRDDRAETKHRKQN